MIIETLAVGMLGANCYILGCLDTKEGMVIDPGGDPSVILNNINKLGLTIKYIVDTHGHYDHIAANDDIKKATGAQVITHIMENEMLEDPQLNLSVLFGKPIKLAAADKLVQDGDLLTIGNLKFTVIHTPGHSKGGMCLKQDKHVFVGDTLFAGGIGRTDFSGGSFEVLMDSIKSKLLVLEEDTIIYPGHGPTSTIGEEKRSNPFL